MITVEIEGREAVNAKLSGYGNKLHDAILKTMTKLAIELHSIVVDDKLDGDVLKRQSGHLAQAQNWNVADAEQMITATVGYSDAEVPYGKYHEYSVPKYWLIEAKNAKFLKFQMNGETVFRRSVMHPPLPERSFLRSALEDIAPRVQPYLEAAIAEAAL